jgi:uncharacterized lipoprotein YajG
MKTLLAASLVLVASVANASPTTVTFSGPSVYNQPIKVSLVEQDSDKHKLLLTVLKDHEQNGLTYQTTEIVDNLECNIDESVSVSCEAVTPEGETVKFYSEPAEEAKRFRIAVEADNWPYYLGYSMVWETR